ncbi:DUF4142 domain-containing protein [Pseudoflavitalea sp. G-6-1-2]|uniref:DUF4142 domain-containing protein n=1 Tax=Pseudoflavitalea sp. G-6-1-2 TaxID=2728841 RepID=UPI00146F2D4F|nr:DUF4142 domain-containing protein [Pseudoflavitalea sp. G-6-1-2]NML22471.1 DUF4142 domain-containing protein [Pseudoflavitalea sp. G-6-1-2]
MKALSYISIGLFLSMAILSSCGESAQRQSPESKERAEKQNEAKFNTDTSEHNAQFVVNAASGNLAEIQLAELAVQKSPNAEIKEIAKMLVNDHTAALNDLKTIASRKNISIPAELTDAAKDQLQKLTNEKPTEFDKSWTSQLMEKHQQTISDYEAALGTVTDPDIQNWINIVLPKIRTHHDKLMAMNTRIKK